MPIAYSYIRFSTAEQSKGDSLRRQLELSENYAAANGLTIDRSLRMHDLGLSAFDGSNLERGALGGFLQAVHSQRVQPGSYLLIESLDRLSRAHAFDALNLFTSILKQGITVVTLADNMVYNRETVTENPVNLLTSILVMTRAHEESATKSRRLKAAWEAKRAKIGEKKLTGQCPRWMRLLPDKSEFVLIPERVEIVMGILQSAREGMGQAQIAKRLNENGVPPFSSYGTGWHGSYIQKVLKSTALYGELQPHVYERGQLTPFGPPIPDYYPALISKEEFRTLQVVRSKRQVGGAKARKGSTMPNLFSGLVKCGYCGSSMVLAAGQGRRGQRDEAGNPIRPSTKFLVCDGGRRGMGCYAVQWNYPEFEKSFLSFCRNLDIESIVETVRGGTGQKEKQLSLVEQIDRVAADIAESSKKIDRLLKVIESTDSDSPEALLQRLRVQELEKTSLQAKKEELETALNAVLVHDKSHVEAAAMLKKSIDVLNTLDGDDSFRVRVALSEQLRNLVDLVQVHPAGRLMNEAQCKEIKDGLCESGFSEAQIESYMHEFCRTSPMRQNRGKSKRYALRKEMKRFFRICFRIGPARYVYPSHDDPSQAVVLADEISGGLQLEVDKKYE